ncbi:MAG TPA: NADH-quinone oxidoreductase subunit N [Pirellulaceae bacterium]|nr:NADH-quinone oxidoreductase subunit N [Pirellulaceae bacterium]
MNLHDLVSQLMVDTKGSPSSSFLAITADSSLWAFLPELILCATVLVMLLVRLFRGGHRLHAGYIALAGSLAALYFAAPWHYLTALPADAASSPAAVTRMEIFTGMLVYDPFSVYLRSVLLLFVALFVIFTRITGIPDREDGADIYTLVLGATLGMCLMATANHLLMVFLAVEMASVPSYVLAGLQKGRRKASEAALKYSIYGAGTAGVMLYGISLLSGLLNTAHLPTIALRLAEKFPHMGGPEVLVLAFAGLAIGVGLAFKLSAVPFHFWCPDVFEGATAEVNAFLSVASKAAALGLLLRVVLGIGSVPPDGVAPGERTLAAMERGRESMSANDLSISETSGPKSTSDPLAVAHVAAQETAESPATKGKTPQQTLAPVRSFIAKLVAFFAIITCTFGNLAAYGQNNLKRLLAYSTIAHAGYMMMPIAAVIALVGLDNAGAQSAVAALAIYIGVYLFMNLGAFAVVAFLRNAMRSEEIPDYAGLIRRAPLTVICFSLILFGLIGLPPLSGFIGKFAAFAALVDAYQGVQRSGQHGGYLLLTLVVGGINTAVSLFYYLRVVKVMTIDEEPRERMPLAWSDVSLAGAFLWLITLPTAVLMVNWNGLSDMAHAAARYLFS